MYRSEILYKYRTGAWVTIGNSLVVFYVSGYAPCCYSLMGYVLLPSIKWNFIVFGFKIYSARNNMKTSISGIDL